MILASITNNINFRAIPLVPQEILIERTKKISELLNKAVENNQTVTLNSLVKESGYSFSTVRRIIDNNPKLRSMYENIKEKFISNLSVVRQALENAALFGTTDTKDPQIESELDNYAVVLTKEINALKRYQDGRVLFNAITEFPLLVDEIISHKFSNGSKRRMSNMDFYKEAYLKNPDLTLDLMHEENTDGSPKFFGREIKRIVEIVQEAPELLEDLKQDYKFVNLLYSQVDVKEYSIPIYQQDSELLYPTADATKTPHHGIDDIKSLLKLYTTSKHKEFINDLMTQKTIDNNNKYTYTAKDIIYIEKELDGKYADIINKLINYSYNKSIEETICPIYFKGSEVVRILEVLKKSGNVKLLEFLIDKKIRQIDNYYLKNLTTENIVKIFEASIKPNANNFCTLVNLFGFDSGFDIYSLTQGYFSGPDYLELAQKTIKKRKWTQNENGEYISTVISVPLFDKNQLAQIKSLAIKKPNA